MQTATWMIYGDNPLADMLASEACRLGHQPILAGGDESFVLPLAAKLNIPYRIFELEHTHQIKQSLDGVSLFICCQFVADDSASLLQQACLQNSCHYLDILPRQIEAQDDHKQQGIVSLSACNFYSLLQQVLLVDDAKAVEVDFNQGSSALWNALLLSLNEYAKSSNESLLPINFTQTDKPSPLKKYIDGLFNYFAWYRQKQIKTAWQKVNDALQDQSNEPAILLNIKYESEEKILHIAPAKSFFTHSMMFFIETILAHKILPGAYHAADMIEPEEWLAMQIFQYGKPLFEINETIS